jgi:hypothetical protein
MVACSQPNGRLLKLLPDRRCFAIGKLMTMILIEPLPKGRFVGLGCRPVASDEPEISGGALCFRWPVARFHQQFLRSIEKATRECSCR